MRIVSWNVFFTNKRRIKKGIQYILSLRPDVVCLQEVSHKSMLWLYSLSGYTVSKCFESKHHFASQKHIYTCTLTKKKPTQIKRYIYDIGSYNSILTKLYAFIAHLKEQHNVLVVRLSIQKKLIQIANTRLSCAIGSYGRLQECQTLIQKTKHRTVPTIYCGDYNVVDNKLFNRLTGWIRGFDYFDYLLDERTAFEQLYQKEQLINVFQGKSTWAFNKPLLQFDHILIPDTFKIRSHTLLKNRYGSDHRVLIADIAI